MPLSLRSFCPGPEFSTETDDCIFVGMVTEDVDIIELVNMIGAIGKDIEESGRVTSLFILYLFFVKQPFSKEPTSNC